MMGPIPELTSRFDEAIRYAHDLHRDQGRKGTTIPYISHLMVVAALVVEHGGDEDQAIAALLHDAAEDQGGLATLNEIERRFGASVAEIVSDCTDAWAEPKPEWRARKKAYLAKLPTKPTRSLLVSLADKVHNAEAILYDFRVHGDALWARFTGGADGTRGYYRELAEFFVKAMPGRLSDRLSRAVAEFAPATARPGVVRYTRNKPQLAVVNEDATPVEVLSLSDDRKAALDKALAGLKEDLPMLCDIGNAPSFKSRQSVISGVIKHVHALRIFANSTKKPERSARKDICFAAGIFPKGFSDRHSEADDSAFVWRWFEQAQTIEAIANAALAKKIVRLLRGGYDAPPYRQHLIGGILPVLFEKIFQRKFPITRGGMGMKFIRYCLERLGERTVEDETIRQCIRQERGVTQLKK
jgi:hypothetical protein